MIKFCCGVFLVCSLLLAFGADATEAQRRQPQPQTPAMGRLSVKTSPTSYPVLVNGKPWGMSGSTAAAEQDLLPGTYLVEIQFPKKTWSKEIAVNAGKRSCVCLTYNERVIEKFCPYDVRVDAPDFVQDGDLITFASSVNYGGRNTFKLSLDGDA